MGAQWGQEEINGRKVDQSNIVKGLEHRRNLAFLYIVGSLEPLWYISAEKQYRNIHW